MSSTKRGIGSLIFGALCAGAAGIGALAMRGPGRPDGRWYRSLRKASYQPSNRAFGPVWTALYAAIAYSGWRIWKATPSTRRTSALALWGSQLLLNGAWTPLFFGARRPRAALADLVALDVAATAYTVAAARVDKRAAGVALPYLGWLGFATALNATIVMKNPGA